MKVRIKKLYPNSIIPTYAKSGDAGLDLTATSYFHDGENFVYGTGLSIEIPEGYVGLIFPRSSISSKPLFLTNSVGVIDSGYRGEILFKFDSNYEYYIEKGFPKAFSEYTNTKENHPLDIYKIGDRIGQLIIMPYPQIEFEEVEELTETVRGANGFGSTN